MTIGIMEVNLVDAHGLSKSDFLNKIDPYVLIQYRSQEHKSTIAKGEGSNPKWNQKFSFRVEYPGAVKQPKLVLKIMDHDTFSSDDNIGQATIYLKGLLEQGVDNGIAELHPQKCRVVDSNKNYCGDIRVGVTFTPRVETETYLQDFGGWKESQWGPSGNGGRRSYHGRSHSRSRSRSRSPRRTSGSRSRHRSRSYSPAPKRRRDYSPSPVRREPRSPRDLPLEQREIVHPRSRSYSPDCDGGADHSEKDIDRRSPRKSGGGRGQCRSSPGRASRSPSGFRSRSTDISPPRD